MTRWRYDMLEQQFRGIEHVIRACVIVCRSRRKPRIGSQPGFYLLPPEFI